MLQMVVQARGGGARGGQQQPAGTSTQASRSSGARGGLSDLDPEDVRQQALAQPRALDYIRRNYPNLANTVQDRDRFAQAWATITRQNQEIEAKKQEEISKLNDDPFDVEAQKKIEEMIHLQRVEENLQNALDYTPEGWLFPFKFPPKVRALTVPITSLRPSTHALHRCGSQQY